MNRTISVIIPVYNVEAYLRQCLDSVLSQSYRDLQVILIDDGSTDTSGMICDEYAAKDQRVTVIHQKNGGAAAAKNAGLRCATGEYLSFVDSDDYLEPGAYDHMIRLLADTGADVIQCSFQNLFTDGVEARLVTERQQCLPVEAYLLRYTRDWSCGLLWDKLYRRTLFTDVFFEEGNKIDDEFFTYRGIMNAQKVILDAQVIYTYRQRASGVMLSDENAARIVLDKLAYLPTRRERIVRKFPALREAFDLHYLNMLLLLARDPYATEKSICREKELLKEYFRYNKMPAASLGLRLAILKLRYMPASKLLQNRAKRAEEKEIHRYFR